MGSLRQRVRERAAGCCEYCQMSQALDIQPFQIDHVRALKHSGQTTAENLAFSCLPCNSYKGPNAAGYDPESNALQPLFNPREDVWADHFEWDGPNLRGMTPVGRATIDVLRINQPDRIEQRRLLNEAGLFPCRDADQKP
jgi:hypothetical protein